MELVAEKVVKKPIAMKKISTSNLLVPLVGGFAIFFSEAFLFNPLVVAILFLSFNISWKNYLMTMITMCFSAYYINIAYGVEISLISFTLLITGLCFARMENHRQYTIYPVIIINIFLAIVMLLRSFSLTNMGTVAIAGSLSIAISITLLEFYRSLMDKSLAMKNYQVGLLLITSAIVGMFNLVMGLMLFRVVTLIGKKVVKKEIGVISTLLGAAILYSGFNIDIEIVITLTIPIILSYFFPLKSYLYSYLFAHIIVMMLLDSQFYTNGLFYQGIACALICLGIPNKHVSKFREHFNREENLALASLSNEEGRLKKRIDELYKYLEVITNSLDKKSLDPKAKAATRVITRVCSKCDHLKYCMLYLDLKTFITESPSSKNKKRFAQECISPYKFSLEITQAYNIFVGEANYYYEAQQRREQFVNSLIHIKKPIKTLLTDMTNEGTMKDTIIASLANNDIRATGLHITENMINIVTRDEIDTNIPLKVLDHYLGTKFSYYGHEIDYFHNEHIYSYLSIPVHEAVYYTYSKAVNPQHSGDYFHVKKENKSISVLLSDGMGHDENAYKSSKFLGTVFESLSQVNGNMDEVIIGLNSIMRFNSEYDSYATMDYIKIDLQNLNAEIYKSGSFASFLLSERGILEITAAGLPLGIIDSPEYSYNEYPLQKNDILIIVSDGIGEVLLNSKQLLNNYWKTKSLNDFGRDLFDKLYDKMIHKDDATLIILQIL